MQSSRVTQTLVWLFACAFALAAAGPLAAQSGTVRGKVTEAGSLRPLSGAQISVPGTGLGALTNAAGDFVLTNVPPGATTIRVDMIGYKTAEQSVTVVGAQAATANFELVQTAIALNELVVTGTAGAVSKRTLGNAISKIDAADVMQKTTITNVTELLQARTPGLTLLPNSGTPGAAADIRIRGISSFSGNRPVVYVDGIRYNTGNLGTFDPSGAATTSFSSQTTSALDLINPNDIESIEVIKGPAAATLYGAEAAGGVIQIITKKGARVSHPMQFDLRMEAAQNDWHLEIPNNFTVCNTARIAELAGGAPVWPGCQGLTPGTILTDNPMRRDPLALRKGDVLRMTASARGGSDRFSYYVSVQNDEEQGVAHNSFSNRRSVRANFTAATSEKLDFLVNTSYVKGDLGLPVGDEAAQGMFLSAMRGFPGRVPPAGDTARAGWNSTNAAMANAYNNTTDSDRFTVGATINARPLSWMRNRLTVGLDYTSNLAQIISPPGSVDAQFAGVPEGIVAQRNPRIFNYTIDYTGSADFRLLSNVLSTTSVGVQAIANRVETVSAAGRGFGAPDVISIGTAQVTSGSNAYSESRNLGYFVQEQLAWNDRLYLTGALRFDDHSAFGSNFDLIVYPKLSLAWVLSDEPAVNGYLQKLSINNFKFRTAWGEAGRAPLPFSATQTYTVDKFAAGGSTVGSALRVNALGNPDLKAERGSEIEVGFDAGLFQDRMGVDFTYYRKRMDDVIVAQGAPGSSGFAGTFFNVGAPLAVQKNLGETLNQGVELGLIVTPVQTRNIVWDSRISLATNANELIAFGDNRTREVMSGQAFAAVQEHRIGYPLAGYWARMPLRNADGTLALNATNQPVLDTAFTFIGPSQPTREISFSNTITLLRNFRLYGLLDYKGGHFLMNFKEYDRCRVRANCALHTDPTKFNLADGTVLDPEVRLRTQLAQGNLAIWAPWIEDASFIKLRDLSLTYQLPSEWARYLRANGASFTIAGHNLALWSDYTGIDPEVNTYGNRNLTRADVYATPMMRRLSASMNLSF